VGRAPFGSRRPVPTGWRWWAGIASDVLTMTCLVAMLAFWVWLLRLLVVGLLVAAGLIR